MYLKVLGYVTLTIVMVVLFALMIAVLYGLFIGLRNVWRDNK
jgi:ABC-type dipeptide/oligopeptide/nickel transport system permease subunit